MKEEILANLRYFKEVNDIPDNEWNITMDLIHEYYNLEHINKQNILEELKTFKEIKEV